MLTGAISAFCSLLSDFNPIHSKAEVRKQKAEMSAGAISAFCFLLSDFNQMEAQR